MMNNLDIGKKFSIEHNVTPGDSASAVGSGFLDVFATPSMVALMEKTAMLCVQEALPQGHGTVGISVNIKHLKATRIGERVNAVATLVEIDKSRLKFEVNIYEAETLVGTGEHERFIINEEKFLAKLG